VSEVDTGTYSTGLVGQLWDRYLKIPNSAYDISFQNEISTNRINVEFWRRGVIVMGVNEV
jgi:hypothetical protein